jgi:hypothetical protein
MFRRLTLALVIITLAGSASEAGVYRGKGGRALCRHSYLVQQWKADKLRVYNEYGYPVHRLRVRAYGEVLEHWTYYEHGREFVFDDEHRLVEVKRFRPEDRRERIEESGGRLVRNPH